MPLPTTVTVRHCDVPDALRAHAQAVVERVGQKAHRPQEAAVVLDVEGLTATAELRMHLSQGDVLVAHGHGPDHRSALDQAEGRLARQVQRASGQWRRARHSAPVPAVQPPPA